MFAQYTVAGWILYWPTSSVGMYWNITVVIWLVNSPRPKTKKQLGRKSLTTTASGSLRLMLRVARSLANSGVSCR